MKIDKKIVGYKVLSKEDKEEAKAKEIEKMHERVNRPDLLLGSTYKVKNPMSDHSLYITINDIVLNEGSDDEQRYPYEIFLNSKNMEHFQWVLALTRVISAVFRKGGDATFLVDELKSVFDPKGGYFKKGGKFMPSLVAEIGDAIESHMKMIGLIQDEQLDEHHKKLIADKRREYESRQDAASDNDSEFPPDAKVCNKCNVKAAILMDGCYTCLNCGDSKCG